MTDRRDANEAQIVVFWKRCGCVWIPQDRRAGFDGLLIVPPARHLIGFMAIVEIKNPEQRWQLTPSEKKRKEEVERAGQDYHIIETLEQAKELIGR